MPANFGIQRKNCHCVKYTGNQVLSNRIFSYKERIVDSVLKQEILVRENPYSGTFHALVLIALIIIYKKTEQH